MKCINKQRTSLGGTTLCWNPRRLGATDDRGLCWYSLRSIISATANIYFYTKTWKTIIHSSKSDYLELYTKYWPWPIYSNCYWWKMISAYKTASKTASIHRFKQKMDRATSQFQLFRWLHCLAYAQWEGALNQRSDQFIPGGWWLKDHSKRLKTQTWSKPPKITGFAAEVFLCFLGWFGTFFIFHNIWDNLSHWLIFFKLVKPPTSRSLDLVIGQNWGCTTWLILMTYSGSMLMQVKFFVETFKIRQECESTDAISHPYGFLVYSNYLWLFFWMVYCLYLDVFSLVCLAEGLRKWSHGSYDALKLGMWSSILVIRTHNRNASN